MFSLLKPKDPQKFLIDTLHKLKTMPDDKKLAFIEKNLEKIEDAMKKIAVPVSHSEDRKNSQETEEWSRGYLNWYRPFIMALNKKDIPIDSSTLSPAASYFLEKTKSTALLAFRELLKLNPVIAFRSFQPAEIFNNEVVQAMEQLVDHENPSLYFKCFNEVYHHYPWNHFADTPDLADLNHSLAYQTERALERLLDKNPDAVLFPHTQDKDVFPYNETYFSYLPDKRNKQRFIEHNINKIVKAVCAIAEGASNQHMKEFGVICNSFSEEERPHELTYLKNLLLSERVKSCFRIAASQDYSKLDQAVQGLNGAKTDMVTITPSEKTKSEIPAYELIRLTNPSHDVKNGDAGADSKHLWMIRKSGTILAAAFSKEGIGKYLEVQTQVKPDELPTVQQWDQFLCAPQAA